MAGDPTTTTVDMLEHHRPGDDCRFTWGDQVWEHDRRPTWNYLDDGRVDLFPIIHAFDTLERGCTCYPTLTRAPDRPHMIRHDPECPAERLGIRSDRGQILPP